MAESKTKFDAAVEYVDNYLNAKGEWLSGTTPRAWFTSGAASLDGLLAVFDPSEEDAEAYKTYQDMKDPANKVPRGREAKYRLRLLFMAAGVQAVRQQYLAGNANGYRTINDTFRYEMANARAVRGCFKKFKRVTDGMAQEKQ